MEKGKILFIGNHFHSSRTNVNVWQEIPLRLHAYGWQSLTTSRKLNKPLRLVDMLSTIYHRRQNYDLAEVDVFSGQAFTWAWASACLLQRLEKRFVLMLRGGNLPQYASAHPHRVSELLNMADQVVAPSAYLAQALKTFRGDIQIIPNPVDIARFPPQQRVNFDAKLVWVRAFHEIYNPSMAIRVLAGLVKNHPEAHLTMIGPDKGDGSFQRASNLAAELGLREHITFTGGLEKKDVIRFLGDNHIFLNTTHVDNTPLSVIEAMASGLAIVSTNVGGVPYLVTAGEDALLVSANDSDSMLSVVEQILVEPELARSLSTHARHKAETFDWSVILPKWDHLFTDGIRKR